MRVPSRIAVTFDLPRDAESLQYTVTIPGLMMRDEVISGSSSRIVIEIDQEELYSQGFTSARGRLDGDHPSRQTGGPVVCQNIESSRSLALGRNPGDHSPVRLAIKTTCLAVR